MILATNVKSGNSLWQNASDFVFLRTTCLQVIIFSYIHFPANDVASFFVKTSKLKQASKQVSKQANKNIPNRID